MRMTLETRRLDAVLTRIGRDATSAVARSLYGIANDILNQSQELVPFEEGILSSSAQVISRTTGSRAEVAITYGGAAAAYALIQHENTFFRHAFGRSDHYLSDPIERVEPMFDVLMAASVERELLR